MESLVKNEFQLYSNLAKPLILNLPAPKDRILAAAWVKKCADENAGVEQLRTTYLKMLLFCLQRRRLSGLFADDPDKYQELEELPLGYDLNELAKNLIEQELDERRDKAIGEITGDTEVSVCFSTDCSPDLTEYVAAQDIPNFGVHVYYALSSKPINKWNRSEKAILPKGTRSAIETSITQGPTGGSASEPSCVCTPRGVKVKSDEPSGEGEDESNLPECKRKREQKEESALSMKRKKRPKKLGQSPPTHPIGEIHRVQEERVTPTWGTNLLDVREPTDIGKIDIPTEEELQLDEEVSRMLEAQDDEDETDGSADEFKDNTQDMLHIIDEWKNQKMDKPKRPSRLDKLGSRSGLKKPSSIKEPKIAVKGMKKTDAKRPMGKKPDNLPEDMAGWTEKDLEEAGLTWADLMPIDDNVDDLLKNIEDEVNAQEDDQPSDGKIHIPYEPTNYDAMIREAEEDLLKSQTAYQVGVEADQDVIGHYDDQIDEFGDEFNISQAAEEMREGSPAIQSRIPVTTPGRAPTPKRVRSSERIFAEEGDFVFKRRTSPFAPIQLPQRQMQDTSVQYSGEIEDFGDRDPLMVQIFEEAKSAVQNISQYQEQSGGQSFSQPASASITGRSRQQPEFRGTPGSSQQERAPLGSPELDSLHFQSKFRGLQGNLFDRSPVSEIASPPQLSDDEAFQMYESFFRDQDSGSTPPRATSTPPPVASGQDSRLQRAQLEIKAWEQEMKLRQGSPEARRIIDDAQGQLMQLGAPGVSGLMDAGAPFPTQRQQRVLPKPAFSPTTGSPLNVPSYDIQPDDLGISYDDVLDIPPLPYGPCGFLSPPAAEQGDLFTRLGAPEITTDDFRPRQPQYFHPGLDIATDDSPPPPLLMEQEISESASGRGYVRPSRPVSGLPPVRERHFEEELYRRFEKIEHKGERVDVRPMSPWRNESIYYTPEIDRTLSAEYPLISPPPRPFVPGVSSPETPPCQFPIQRPGGFATPHDYGEGVLNVTPPQFDMLPDYYTPGQRTPTESRRIPGMPQFDRAPCQGAVRDSYRKVASPRGSRRHLGASDAFGSVGGDQYGDFQTPRRQVGQSRRRLFHRDRTTCQTSPDLSPHSTPEGVAGPSRRPTELTPPFYNSDFESPPSAPVPVQRFPAAKRIKKRGKYPATTEPESPLPDIPQFSLQWEDDIQAQQDTNVPDFDDIRFRVNYRFRNENLFDSPPALEAASPLQESGQDTFEMYESFYRDQDSGSTPIRAPCTPPPTVADRDQQRQRAQLELKAWEQEMKLRQGSPEASGPPGIPTLTDEQAPFCTQRRQRIPPKPAFSPTTGSPLPVPDYDIQPDDLGLSYDEVLDFRSFSPRGPCGSSSPQAAEQGELFTRLGAPEITTDDLRPRQPQYFHPGLDMATDESPPPPLFFSDYEVSSFGEGVRPSRSTCLSPVREEPYDEEIYRSLEDIEYKGKHVDARPMSPWRNESIYYTPGIDKTLPMDSSASSQFIPGITSPATPPCQFPVQRPDSFATPDYGEGILNVTPPPFNVLDEQSPCQRGAGSIRQMSPALSPHWTPEGVAGPSRRPTGLTPPFYNSDFESPPPSPAYVQRFPAAKRIKKRGRYPPSTELPLPDIPQFALQWEDELRAQQQQQINENLIDPAFISRFEDERYSFNETPPDLQEYDNLVGQVSPCTPAARPITPPRYPPIRTPPSVPSGSPRTPPLPCPSSQVTAPSVATRGAGARRIPVKKAKPDIYTTRSQILRMKKMEQQKKAAQTISPVSKRLQENRARLAQIDEDRRQAAARRQAQPSQKRSIPRFRGTSRPRATGAAPSQLPQSTTRPVPVRPSGIRPPAAVRGGQVRQIPTRKDVTPPCGPCPTQQDEYGSVLTELGLTEDEAASAFNTDFLQDMEGEFEPNLSNNDEEIQVLEDRISEIDSYIASHDELMRQYELELGLSPQQPYTPTTSESQRSRLAQRKTPAKKKLTVKQQKMLDELKAIEERLEQIEPTAPTQEEEEEGVDEVERRVIQREREEREYFEKLFRGEIVEEPPSPYSEEPAQLSFEAQGQICPGAGVSPIQYDAEEQELREFEQLEREMADGQGQVCPGATALPDDALDQSGLRRRLLQQEIAIQGPPRTGLQYPAQGITYSPQRPMETFGQMPPRPIQTRPPSPCAVPFTPPQDNVPLVPKSLRKDIRAAADRRFHPAKRRDLSREDRRVIRGPPLSMFNIPERPTDAATSFMGVPYMKPSQKQKQKEMERIGRDINFYKSDVGKQVMELERRHGVRRELFAPCSPLGEDEDHPFDEPVPRGLPQPLAPCYGSPIRPTHYTRVVDPFPQVDLQPLQFETFGPDGPPPLHPDLREVAQWEPPFDLGDTTAISAESYGEEFMYSPEQLPGPEPLTPPSCGKGPCGTYSPGTSPPLGILESPDLRMYDPHDLQIFDEGLVDQQDVRSFFHRSPQPAPSTSVDADFDFFVETKASEGRKGIKPKPQFFGGYGERPKKYLPRWYGQRGPNLNIISEEGDIPPSPPVSSHGTPCGPRDTSGLDEFLLPEQQFAQEAARHQNSLAFDEQADRRLSMSPEQREFEMLEAQMSQQRRPCRISAGHRQFAERSRQAMIDEMAEEAERNRMNRMRVPSPPQRVPSPCPAETFGPELASRLDTSGIMDQSFGQYVTPPCSPVAREEFQQFTPPISPRGIRVCTPQLPEAGNLADIYQDDTRGFLEESFIGAPSPPHLSDGAIPSYDYQGAEQMVLGDAGGFPEMSGFSDAGMLEEETFPELSPGRRNPTLERYIETMQRQQEARRLEEQASQQRRAERYRQAMDELYQQNLPSPVSPGPDADFLANVYMHHVSPSFTQGERSYIRGGMPRRAPAPSLGTITKPRVRIESPKPAPKRHKHKHGKQIIPPPSHPGRTSSARRVEEARRLYKEISRQREVSQSSERSRVTQQGAVPRPRGICSSARPSAQPPPPRPFTGFVPTQVASQPGAGSRVTQRQGAASKSRGVSARSSAQPPPPRPFTGFVPTQVRASSRGRSGCGGSSQGRSGCGSQC